MGTGQQKGAGGKRGAKSPDRVLLTGFRATGKTVVGSRVAHLLGYRFVDTDEELASRMGCSIAEYVSREGWPAFRSLEKELLTELATVTKVVIATGGGAIQHFREWEELRKDSLAVWLQADAETIRQRLSNDSVSSGQRPSLTGGDMLEEIDSILAEREPFYRKGSDIQIDTAGRSREEVALLIKQLSTVPETV